MDKVFIFYGPQNGFEAFVKGKIGNDTPTSFSTLVRKSDEINREHRHLVQGSDAEVPESQPIKIDNLIIASDEYASVREHVILNFDGFISGFVIGRLFLHNPPELISNKIKKAYPQIEEDEYVYPRITKEIILEFNKSYSSKIVGQQKVRKDLLVAIYPLLRTSFKKPIVLLFYGPSGVGKTETAKFLSKLLGGKLFRKQLSMFQNNDFVTYLFGGHHYEKSFAKDLLERETNVVLLDEFDKANNIFHSAFYQLFDEGIFVDKNYCAKVGESIIICTSNYLSLEEIKKHLGDPIFSRFDACIKFDSLKKKDIENIIKLRIDQEFEQLEDHEQVRINKEEIISQFLSNSDKFDNARRIESLVREVFSLTLLDFLLNEVE